MSDAFETPAETGLPPAATPLTRAALEIDEYASKLGWDLPARLFALVDSAELRRTDPKLAKQLGLGPEQDGALTPVEQDELPPGRRWTSSSAPSSGRPWWPAAPWWSSV